MTLPPRLAVTETHSPERLAYFYIFVLCDYTPAPFHFQQLIFIYASCILKLFTFKIQQTFKRHVCFHLWIKRGYSAKRIFMMLVLEFSAPGCGCCRRSLLIVTSTRRPFPNLGFIYFYTKPYLQPSSHQTTSSATQRQPQKKCWLQPKNAWPNFNEQPAR